MHGQIAAKTSMGQGGSQPERAAAQHTPSTSSPSDERHRRRHSSFGTLIRNIDSYLDASQHPDSGEDAGGLLVPPSHHTQARPRHSRSSSTNRLSRLLHTPSNAADDDAGPSSPRRSALQRSRTTLSNMFRRDSTHHSPHRSGTSRAPGILQHRASYVRASGSDGGAAPEDFHPPRLPSIDQTSTFDRDLFTWADTSDALPRSSHSLRRPNLRFNALRPDRPFRHLTSSLRRRRSPPPTTTRRSGGTEDQAILLSQLLSAAAAATAATLMGDDHQALSEARSLSIGTGIGDLGGNGEDGSFDGFLRALQNGRIASALRQSSDSGEGSDPASQAGPLNFFRMFRFGTPTLSNAIQSADPRVRVPQPSSGAEGTSGSDGRMVPIIIVGIRSISPSSNSGSGSADDLPPFLDALTNFASPVRESEDLGSLGHSSIDSILRPPQNGTSFRHRRRASMGGFGIDRSRINDRYDDQRDHRSPDRRRDRPWSIASSTSNEPRPPPATPASPSPELSRVHSRNTTPAHSRPASSIANSTRELAGDSRRNSVLRRSTASPLSSHTEESVSMHSTHSSDNLLQQSRETEPSWTNIHRRSEPAPNVHYPRFASGHPRRNGVVEPDNLPPLSRTSTSNAADASSGSHGEARNSSNDSRSWIIYVLGGSYPENHPILTTPSLFSDNPTYEDMMLLSALLGPAKAPVASEEDVQNAGGVYNLIVVEDAADAGESTDQNAKQSSLVAVATEGTDTEANPERIAIDTELRCLVCLGDFEASDVARRLGKCGHLFHKECIDHVSL